MISLLQTKNVNKTFGFCRIQCRFYLGILHKILGLIFCGLESVFCFVDNFFSDFLGFAKKIV